MKQVTFPPPTCVAIEKYHAGTKACKVINMQTWLRDKMLRQILERGKVF